ncbi:MAG: cell division protein FtsL [Pseudomonadota bacterium]
MSGRAVLSRGTGSWLAVTVLLAFCAVAIALVYTRHESRQLFVELQKLSKERDALQIEWRQLQLEQHAYAAHGRIEEKAIGPLSLVRPQTGDIFLITDQGDYRFVGLKPVGDELQSIADTATPNERGL